MKTNSNVPFQAQQTSVGNNRDQLIKYMCFNKPSADEGLIFLVHTCTENGVSDIMDEMIVMAIEPLDSTALLSLRNWMAMVNNKSLCSYIMIHEEHVLCVLL